MNASGGKKEQHFVTHIARQFLGVFAIGALAILIGTAFSQEARHSPDGLAQAIGSTTQNTALSDMTPPQAPAALLPTAVTPTSVTIAFTEATDNVGISGYKVFRNGQLFGQVNFSPIIDASVIPGAEYTYYVKAVDHAGNESAPSPGASISIPTSASLPGGTTPTPVEFSVLPAEGIGAENCSNGLATTDVFFFINPTSGGSIEITPSGKSPFIVSTDHGPLPNGSYSWKGLPASGSVVSGVSGGSFVLNARCDDSTSSGAGLASSALQQTIVQNTPAAASPRPDVYASAVKVADGTTLKGDITVVLREPSAKSVVFMLVNEKGARHLYGRTEGVTILSGTDIWSVRIKTTALANGIYRVGAIVESETGKKQETGSLDIILANSVSSGSVPVEDVSEQPLAENRDVPQPPRPQLKFFINERPLANKAETDAKEIELRVVAPLAKDVSLFLEGSGGKKILLGNATEDDLLSLPGFEVWSYIWKIGPETDGEHRIFARAGYASGEPQTSEVGALILSRQEVVSGVTAGVVAGETDANNIVYPGMTITPEAAARTLEYVTDPSQCGNREECAIYCGKKRGEEERCIDYARTDLGFGVGRESLADGISAETIEQLLLAGAAKDIFPATVVGHRAFAEYCAQETHLTECTKVLTGEGLLSEPMLSQKTAAIKNAEVRDMRFLSERTGARAFVDTDRDGITDYDEINLYHTDPGSGDTDRDGFPDGKELLARTNPRGGVVNDVTGENTEGAEVVLDEFIPHADPFLTESAAPESYSIDDVSARKDAVATEGNSSSTTRTMIVFRGKALPNTIVTLYVYSDPIVSALKADEEGNWTYTLTKDIPDAAHTAFAALLGADGHIIARSLPFSFIKTPEGVTGGSELLRSEDDSLRGFGGERIVAVAAAILGLLGLSLSVIGIMAGRKKRLHHPVPLRDDIYTP